MKSIYRFSSLTLFCLAVWLLTATPVKAQEPITLTTYLPLVFNGYDPSWSWSIESTPTLTPTVNTVYHPLLAIDREGQVHFLWQPIASPQFIYHTYLTATGWTSPTAVAPSLGNSSLLFPPVIAPDGKMHFLWLNRETTQQPYRTLYAVFDHQQWGPEETVFRAASTSYTIEGMVHLDEQGKIHATMAGNNLLVGYTYHTIRNNTWSTPITISRPTNASLVWPDRWGGIHYYGNDYLNPPNIHYFYWQNGQFLVQNRQTPGKISGYTTQLDGNNNLHLYKTGAVAIPGGQVTGLYYRCLDRNLNLGPEQVLSGQNPASNVVKNASCGGLMALAWNEGNSPAAVRVAVWNSCTQIYLKTVPFPAGVSWTPHAVAVSESPNKVCVLGYTLGYPTATRYRVICADILQ